MKYTRITLTAASLFLASSAFAGLPAYDALDYPSGEALKNQNGGTGWTSAWSTSSQLTVESSSVSVTYEDANGNTYGGGNSVFFSGGNSTVAATRQFLESPDTSGDDVYFRFVFRVENGSTTGTIDTESFMTVGIMDGDYNTGTDNFVQINGTTVGSRVDGNKLSITGTTVQYQTSYLIVGKLGDWDNGSYNSMTVWLDPTYADENTVDPSIAQTNIQSGGANGFQGIAFRTLNLATTGDIFYYDDLKIGTSWNEVVIPESGSTSLFLAIFVLVGIALLRKKQA